MSIIIGIHIVYNIYFLLIYIIVAMRAFFLYLLANKKHVSIRCRRNFKLHTHYTHYNNLCEIYN